MTIHVFHLYGAVTPVWQISVRDLVLAAIHQHSATEIHLRISSVGGDLTTGFTLYGLLRSLPVPVTTINISNVESSAVLIYMAGQERIATPHSRFLIHPFNWTYPTGQVDHQRLAEHVDLLNFDVNRYTEILNERTHGAKNPVDVLAALNGRPAILGATAAEEAAISTRVSEVVDREGATHWWPQMA